MQGLSLDDKSHVAALRALEGAGLRPGVSGLDGITVILDWGTAREYSADGVALFQVVVRVLVGAGATVFILPPATCDMREIVDSPEMRASCEGAIWVDGACDDADRVLALGSVGSFSSSERGTSGAFCAGYELAMSRVAMPGDLRKLLNGIVWDVIQNVVCHAEASYAAILGLHFHRKRPGLLEIGVADDGRGMADALLDQPDHRWMDQFLDVSLLENLFRRNLSSRSGMSDSASPASGGLGALLGILFSKAPVTVLVRSNRVLIQLASDGSIRRSHTLSCGVGTQLRIAIRLPGARRG